MSKKEAKETDPTKEGDVAETTQGATPVIVSYEIKSIDSEEIAIEFIRRDFPHLVGKNLLVTQDRNVFEPENISSGANHAERNNLKSFRIKA
jgi:hypothetical protein